MKKPKIKSIRRYIQVEKEGLLSTKRATALKDEHCKKVILLDFDFAPVSRCCLF
jgi:hypothetical protein